jgi:hypothetical protein
MKKRMRRKAEENKRGRVGKEGKGKHVLEVVPAAGLPREKRLISNRERCFSFKKATSVCVFAVAEPGKASRTLIRHFTLFMSVCVRVSVRVCVCVCDD